MRWRFAIAAAVTAAAALALTLLVVRPRLEAAVARRMVSEAASRGWALDVAAVRLGLWPPLSLQALRVRRQGGVEIEAAHVRVFLRPLGRGLVGRVSFDFPRGASARAGRGLSLRLAPTSWKVEREAAGEMVLRRTGAAAGFALRRASDSVRLELRNEALGEWLELSQEGRSLLHPGPVFGSAELRGGRRSLDLEVDLEIHDLSLVGLESIDGGRGTHAWGAPSPVEIHLGASWREAEGDLRLRTARVRTEAAEGEATAEILGLTHGGLPRGSVKLDLKRVEMDRLFALLAVSLPFETHGLGQMRLKLDVDGSVESPQELRVGSEFVFTPPSLLPEAIVSLRRPFDHTVKLPDGTLRVISLTPESPDFVAAEAVPPLLKRALLLAEDSGFFGHCGVDLGEIPRAFATDWALGKAARGASTLTQQLARNLFLSREKRVSRKLKELAIALLMERALSKERILEIYLNVIEWGPGVYGLRRASHHYFGKEPQGLTPGESAFLVAIIPGPIKYQRSIAKGEMSERFKPLVENLLAKLLSVGALDEVGYQAALGERLRFQHLPLPPPDEGFVDAAKEEELPLPEANE